MEYGAQVIVEKTFKSEEDARKWMEKVVASLYEKRPDHVESHLWEAP